MNYPKEPKTKDLEYDSSLKLCKDIGALGAHDPSIFKDGDMYYVFSTDTDIIEGMKVAVQVRKSRDLINWTYEGTVLDDVPTCAKLWTKAKGIWAPEVIKVKDKYYLYYCASTFGKNRSCIGLLKSDSLSGPWQDCGIVLKTDNGDDRNAIDPNLIYDKYRQLWLAYGSFWSGIYIVKLDETTGKIKEEGDMGIKIASRSYCVEGAVEGAYIIYNKIYDKYYLFVSYDSLSSDYNIRVGRADNIEGPYVDINGVLMTNTKYINPNHVGNKIMGGYRFGGKHGFIGPGHNSVLNDNGDFYIVHHIRKEDKTKCFYMHVRKILWSRNDWPMVSPERYAGETDQAIKKNLIVGLWEIIILYPDTNRIINSNIYNFIDSGNILGQYKGEFLLEKKNDIKLKLFIHEKYEVYEGKVMPAWDWEENNETLIITAINEKGVALWGKRSKDKV